MAWRTSPGTSPVHLLFNYGMNIISPPHFHILFVPMVMLVGWGTSPGAAPCLFMYMSITPTQISCKTRNQKWETKRNNETVKDKQTSHTYEILATLTTITIILDFSNDLWIHVLRKQIVKFPDTIRRWNMLPLQTVSSTLLSAFRKPIVVIVPKS